MDEQRTSALLRRKEVEARTCMSRALLYAKLNPNDVSYDPTFPIPVRIGAVAVRWVDAEVEAWIASRPRAVRGAKA